MAKVWLDSYSKDTPTEINPEHYASIVELFEKKCRELTDKPAFTSFNTTLSYKRLLDDTTSLSAYLQSLGLQRGERVALMMPNCLQYPISLFATLMAGLVVVNVNPLYTARELEHQLNDSGAETIIISATSAHILADVIDKTRIKNVVITNLGDCVSFPRNHLLNFALKHVKRMIPDYHLPKAVSFKKAMKIGKRSHFQHSHISGNDLAFLQYTGGTTGVSKGAALTHRNIIANIEQTSAWLHASGPLKAQTIMTALPLYHIFALTVNCLTFIKSGGHNILITNPKDIADFVRQIQVYRPNVLTGVNTLFNALLQTDEFKKTNFSSLKLVIAGGMAIQQSVAKQWHETTGVPILQGYGLSETSPCVTMCPLNQTEFSGSIGLPLPSTDVSLRDENGQPLAGDGPGELAVKGPQVMKGYWKRPDETAKTFTDDGYLLTGDIATMDKQGFFAIVDRKKDMILVSGFNVFPNEIEDVISAHAGVAEVACIGIPNESSGEAVKVFIVKKDPKLSKKDITVFCKAHLTGYKVPKQVQFLDTLPKSNVGKILRRQLKQRDVA